MRSGVSLTLLDLGADRFHGLARELGVTGFGLNLIVLAPGQRGRIHVDERHEVYVVLEGELTLALADAEHALRRGDVADVAPDVRRQLADRGPGRCAVLAVGGGADHEGRDGLAFTSWKDTDGRRPQDVPLPADLPVER